MLSLAVAEGTRSTVDSSTRKPHVQRSLVAAVPFAVVYYLMMQCLEQAEFTGEVRHIRRLRAKRERAKRGKIDGP